tara:strand:+ start:40 stop:273 length:234 start_codon:yes stop_codon:yes gene_type:complete
MEESNEFKKRKESLNEKVKTPTQSQLLYQLKFHERYWCSISYKDILRIPGGWIYSDWNSASSSPMNGIFVPFNNEFM